MTEIIRKDSDYAIRILVGLALKDGEAPIAAKVLARTQEIPEDFIYKILRKLTRAGLTTGYMGTHGGFRLTGSPQDITMLQVVSAIQGPVVVRKCCLDIESCPRQGACNISIKLGVLQDSLTDSLVKITLADILKENRSRVQRSETRIL